jgi:hypothetical protein
MKLPTWMTSSPMDENNKFGMDDFFSHGTI